MITPYHARYYALELRRRGLSGEVDAVGSALFDAQVDLNPHQIEAALFGIRASADEGRLLADEVGLGKTIEAALVLCQLWAERRRRLLVICPASLRHQWLQEIDSKFGLPTRILDARNEPSSGLPSVAICSYQYAARRAAWLAQQSWDLVVCDEAHRLRNAWKPDSRYGRPLIQALAQTPKLLLTATPLQNTLWELYGLVSLLDQKTFGDPGAFRARYMRSAPDVDELRSRLRPLCQRTLRKDVLAYVRYTARRSLTWRFTASADEQKLYRAVSDFLARDGLLSLPLAQRGLITMVLRKLLASSSAAIAGALETLRRSLLEGGTPEAPPAETWEDEGFDDEWVDSLLEDSTATTPAQATQAAREAEAKDLEGLIALARSIPVDRRADALVGALAAGFEELHKQGAPEKAVIFTESRRTQEALRRQLEERGYAGRVVCFNGSNDTPEARRILDVWLKAHPGAEKTASRSSLLRTALVDHFREHGTLLIATEAGAEGLNLQFCSLAVNYDLPWNPQRVEQRIGRCHRYGQKHDVVVINFLDESNAAERRVLELLTDKLHLFDGVFGSSDEVLGAIESGVGVERKIHRIFETCRAPGAIEAAFEALRAEMEPTIKAKEEKARRALLEHFDADVHDRLKFRLDAARERLDRMGRLFWALTGWVLQDCAQFDDDALSFQLHRPPLADVPPGTYSLVSRQKSAMPESFVYRLSHPLGEHVLQTGANAATPVSHVIFDSTHHPVRIAAAEALRGQSGWMALRRLEITGLQSEEHLIFAGFDSHGRAVDTETCTKLFALSGRVESIAEQPGPAEANVAAALERGQGAAVAAAAERNHTEFQHARDRLERWSDDQIRAAEIALDEARLEIRALEKRARVAATLDEQRGVQQELAQAEHRQRQYRQRVFSVEDDVRARRNALIDELEKRVAQRATSEHVFTIAWTVV